MRLNPHVHAVFLDGAWHEEKDELVFVGLGHLGTSEVGAVFARTIWRIERHLRRRGVLPGNEDDDLHADPETGLAAAAVSGQVPPAGPQWTIRLRPPERRGARVRQVRACLTYALTARVDDWGEGQLSDYLRSLPPGTRSKEIIDQQIREERGYWS